MAVKQVSVPEAWFKGVVLSRLINLGHASSAPISVISHSLLKPVALAPRSIDHSMILNTMIDIYKIEMKKYIS